MGRYDHLLNKRVKYIGKNINLRGFNSFLVIGHDHEGIIIHNENFKGHDGTGESRKTWIKDYKTPEKRGKHCWWVAEGNVKIHDGFKDIFNKLEKV